MRTNAVPHRRPSRLPWAPGLTALLLAVPLLAAPASAESRGSGYGHGGHHRGGTSGYRGHHGSGNTYGGSHHRSGRTYGHGQSGRGHDGGSYGTGGRHSGYSSGHHYGYSGRHTGYGSRHYYGGRHYDSGAYRSSRHGYSSHYGHYGYRYSPSYYSVYYGASPYYGDYGYYGSPGYSFGIGDHGLYIGYQSAPRIYSAPRGYDYDYDASWASESAVAIPSTERRPELDRYQGAVEEPIGERPGAVGGAYDLRAEPARTVLSIAPADASVYLDGRFLGLASELPRELLIDPGSHRLEVLRPGFLSQAVDFDAEPRGTVELDVRLNPESGQPR